MLALRGNRQKLIFSTEIGFLQFFKEKLEYLKNERSEGLANLMRLP
jgi:hypothetical protein